MIEWKDFIKENKIDQNDSESIINIKCPKCGSPLYINNMKILTSYPPKREYKCHNCEFIGYH